MATKQKSSVIRVYNNSMQQVALQMRPPASEFYTNEQQVRLNPGKDCLLPKSHVRMEQIDNLRKKGILKVLYDSDVAEESALA